MTDEHEQPPAFELGPVVVAVLGQQLAAVERERALAGSSRPVAPRVGGSPLEDLPGPQLGSIAEHESDTIGLPQSVDLQILQSGRARYWR